MAVSQELVTAALATVDDPEIKKPITELNMVESVEIADSGAVAVKILLTTAGCPLKDRLVGDITAAVTKVEGVSSVAVDFGVMSDEQKENLRTQLRGGRPTREIPFAQPSSLTRVFAIASGKGGVGKSSTTVNLAVAMASSGLKVGIVDADVYGHSVPRLLGNHERPTQAAGMIIPPEAYGVKFLSMEMFKPDSKTPVSWRGPMLHRALEQFLSDAYWGDLDVLLLDLPPGTGDIAISLGQMLPASEIVVVTTPQLSASEVAERAGLMAIQMRQRVVGVVENMAYLPCAHCGEKQYIFGEGGGAKVAEDLTKALGYDVPLLASIPLDPKMREGGDTGAPIVMSGPDTEAAAELTKAAGALTNRSRGLAGRPLGLSLAKKLPVADMHSA